MAKLATLTDNFNGSSLDSAKWASDGAGVVTVANGVCKLTYPSGAASTARIYSLNYYDLTSSYVSAKFKISSSTGGARGARLEVYALAGGITVSLWKNSNVGYISWSVSGDATQHNFTPSWTIGDTFWLRLRHNGSALFFGVSQDGATWAETSETYTFAQAPTNAQVHIDSTLSGSIVDVDKVNIAPFPKLQTLTDDFNGSALDGAKWYTALATGATATVGGGVLTLSAGSSFAYSAVRTDPAFDLIDSSFLFKVNGATTGSDGFRAIVAAGSQDRLFIEWYPNQGYISAGLMVAGSTVDVLTLGTYSAPAKQWFRIRHVSGSGVYFATGPDSSSWTSEVGPLVPTWDVGAVYVDLSVLGTSPTSVTYDRINMPYTLLSGADTVTGTESVGIFTSKLITAPTDAVTRTESNGTLNKFFTVGDTVTGGEAVTAQVVVSGAETGSTAEAHALTTGPLDADTVGAVDAAIQITERITLPEQADTSNAGESSGTIAEIYGYSDADLGQTADATTGRGTYDVDTASDAEGASTSAVSVAADTGATVEDASSIGLDNAEDAQGADEASVTASSTSADSGSIADASLVKASTSTDASAVVDTLTSRDATVGDTVAATDAVKLHERLQNGADSSTESEATKRREFTGLKDARSVAESAGTVYVPPDVPVADADSSTTAEDQTVAKAGEFSTVPIPRVWVNGDDLSAGTLNQEWRDTFRYLLGYSSPGFSGYNSSGSLTYTSGVAIPLTTEKLKRGNLTHAANSARVFVYEDGWYFGLVQIGANTTGVTTGATFLTATVNVNGVVRSASDTVRGSSGGLWTVNHAFSLFLNVGDYVEMTLTGTWTGSITSPAESEVRPRLDLYWRTN